VREEPYEVRPPAASSVSWEFVNNQLEIKLEQISKYLQHDGCEVTTRKLCNACVDVFGYHCADAERQLRAEYEKTQLTTVETTVDSQSPITGTESLKEPLRAYRTSQPVQYDLAAMKDTLQPTAEHSVIHYHNVASLIAACPDSRLLLG
jgi:hypothetical protein